MRQYPDSYKIFLPPAHFSLHFHRLDFFHAAAAVHGCVCHGNVHRIAENVEVYHQLANRIELELQARVLAAFLLVPVQKNAAVYIAPHECLYPGRVCRRYYRYHAVADYRVGLQGNDARGAGLRRTAPEEQGSREEGGGHYYRHSLHDFTPSPASLEL